MRSKAGQPIKKKIKIHHGGTKLPGWENLYQNNSNIKLKFILFFRYSF